MKPSVSTKLEFLTTPQQLNDVVKRMRLQRIKSPSQRIEYFYDPESRHIWMFDHDERRPANTEIEYILSEPKYEDDLEIRKLNRLPCRRFELVYVE